MAGIDIPVGIKNAGFKKGLDEMRGQAAKFGADIKGSLTGALSLGALLAGFDAMLEKFGKVQDMAERFGISAESIQRVGTVAEQAGPDIDLVAKAMSKLTIEAQKAVDGGAEQIKMFQDVGINAKAFRDMGLEQKLLTLATAWQEHSQSGEGTARMMTLLGSKAQALIPLLAAGTAELGKQLAAVKTLSASHVAVIDEIGDAWTRSKQKVSVFFATVALFLVKMTQSTSALVQGLYEVGGAALKNIASPNVNPMHRMGPALRSAGQNFADIWNPNPPAQKSKADGETAAENAEAAKKRQEDEAKADKQNADERKKLEEDIAKLREEAVLKTLDAEQKLDRLRDKEMELQQKRGQWVHSANARLEMEKKHLELLKEKAAIQEKMAADEKAAAEKKAALQQSLEEQTLASLQREAERKREKELKAMTPKQRKAALQKEQAEWQKLSWIQDMQGDKLAASTSRHKMMDIQERLDAESPETKPAASPIAKRDALRSASVVVDSLQAQGGGGGIGSAPNTVDRKIDQSNHYLALILRALETGRGIQPGRIRLK